MATVLLQVLLVFNRGRTGYLLILVAIIMFMTACMSEVPEVSSLRTRVAAPILSIEPGEHDLGLGGLRLVNRSMVWRDGFIYIPKVLVLGRSMPLLVWLHGGGGSIADIKHIIPLAEYYGVVILALESRHNTWDAIDGPYGPDVLFIDNALRYIFQRVNIDPQRVGLGGYPTVQHTP